MRLLFVCLGNICRSPTAEGVMAHLISANGLDDQIKVDSAGTGGWHLGSPPDRRAQAAAAGRGIALRGPARQVADEDFRSFDLILAMDRSNLAELISRAGHESSAEIRLLREYDPACAGLHQPEVPDPYYGAAGGFEEVLDMVSAACEGLLVQIFPALAR